MDSYADDSNISAYLTCFKNLILNLQNDLKSIISWCNVNKMALNAIKSRFMIICTEGATKILCSLMAIMPVLPDD